MTQTDSLVGKRLGSIQIIAELGRGGMGQVYRAQQLTLGREVAVKILPRWLAEQPGFAARFVSEARAAARLQHANIVTIYDVCEIDGVECILMELVRGETLESLLLQGRLAPMSTLRIAEQIASALDYAHAEGVVHRDVKPANIMLDGSERAVLTDFGIARAAEGTTQRTMTGTILGTPEYMAPEQAEGHSVTSAADEYAFACVLFEMLTGSPPFHADSPLAVILDQVRTPPPRPSRSAVGLPPDLDRVFARALAKDPTVRYPSCAALVAATRQALTGEDVAPRQAFQPIASVAPRRTKRPLLAVAAAVVASAALMALVVGTSRLGYSAPPVQIPATATAVVMVPPFQTATPAATPEARPSPTAPAAETSVAPSPTPTTAAAPAVTVAPTASPRPTSTPTAQVVVPTAVPVAPKPPQAPSGAVVAVRKNDAGGTDLFRVNPVNDELKRLVGGTAAWNWAPVTSPDGSSLAFASGKPGAADIVVSRSDGSGSSVVGRSSDLKLGSPAWMPNGQTLGVDGTSEGLGEIFTVSRSGGALSQLTHTPDIDGTRIASWPRSGGSLAVTGKQAGIYRVFVQNPGGDFRAVSPAGVDAYAPAWSPDGSRLAFQSGGGALSGIVTMAADGSDIRRIVVPSGGAWARAPAWSPDGKWIAYVSNQDAPNAGEDYGDLYVVPSNGGSSQRLTFDGKTYDWRPAWLP
jgi:serine/threonine-protein kinase